jgi:hypothetical protein
MPPATRATPGQRSSPSGCVALVRSVVAVGVGVVADVVALIFALSVLGNALGSAASHRDDVIIAFIGSPSGMVIGMLVALSASAAGGWSAGFLAGRAEVAHALVEGILAAACCALLILLADGPPGYVFIPFVLKLPAAWVGGHIRASARNR